MASDHCPSGCIIKKKRMHFTQLHVNAGGEQGNGARIFAVEGEKQRRELAAAPIPSVQQLVRNMQRVGKIVATTMKRYQ